METVVLSLSSAPALSLHNSINRRTPCLSLRNLPQKAKMFSVGHSSSSLCFNPLSLSSPKKFESSINNKEMATMRKKSRGSGAVCYAAPFTVSNLQWISAVSSAVLMLAKGSAVQKSFIVPLFALQAPQSLISWIKGEYGIWAAFLALLVRLFFFLPGELELPFVALLMVIVAPYEVMNLRGRQAGTIISFVIAGYMAFQHFSQARSLQRAFDQARSGPMRPIAMKSGSKLYDTEVAELGSPVGSAAP